MSYGLLALSCPVQDEKEMLARSLLLLRVNPIDPAMHKKKDV
jgi:hypothetical protein